MGSRVLAVVLLSIFRYRASSVVVMSPENSPTWYTWPRYVYSYATASTSSALRALLMDM